MKVIKIHGECLEQNTYILPIGNDECIIIDTGAYYKRISKVLDFLKLNCIAQLVTHGHFDHILGVGDLQQAGGEVYMHEDAEKMVNSSRNLAKSMGLVCKRFGADYKFFGDEKRTLSGLEVQVISTPGHSDGSVCYKIKDMLFTGDTLFRESYGATHFPTGDYNKLKNSIINKLFVLEENLKIFTGHDTEPRPLDTLINNSVGEKIYIASSCTTLNHEKEHNPIFLY